MKLPRLLHTTALRLAVRYLLVYALLLAIAGAGVLWVNYRYVDAQIKTSLYDGFQILLESVKQGDAHKISSSFDQLQSRLDDDAYYFILVTPQQKKLAGNLHFWPSESDIELDGQVHSVWIEDNTFPHGSFEDDAYVPTIATRLSDGTRLLLIRAVEQAEDLQEMADYLIEGLGASVILALLMGLTMGRAMLARMDTISRTAGEIMAGDLSRRIPVTRRNDEFDSLATQLNTMLDRIQLLIQGIREVTDNIAHDLRSPLTRLRNRLEVSLLEERDVDEYRQTLSQGIEDAESLIKTFNSLLLIAQTEAGNHREQWQTVDLVTLIADLEDLYRPSAEANHITFNVETTDYAQLRGNRELLAQMLSNLLENAIKYTPSRGAINLSLNTTEEGIIIKVADTGPGIPASERDHVLERFVRLDDSRHTEGNGLGLSLVKAVCQLHQAELLLSDDSSGLLVSIIFKGPSIKTSGVRA